MRDWATVEKKVVVLLQVVKAGGVEAVCRKRMQVRGQGRREREREKVAGNVDPLDGHVQGRYCGDPGVCQQLSDELVGEAGSKRRLFDESKQ